MRAGLRGLEEAAAADAEVAVADAAHDARRRGALEASASPEAEPCCSVCAAAGTGESSGLLLPLAAERARAVVQGRGAAGPRREEQRRECRVGHRIVDCQTLLEWKKKADLFFRVCSFSFFCAHAREEWHFGEAQKLRGEKARELKEGSPLARMK